MCKWYRSREFKLQTSRAVLLIVFQREHMIQFYWQFWLAVSCICGNWMLWWDADCAFKKVLCCADSQFLRNIFNVHSAVKLRMVKRNLISSLIPPLYAVDKWHCVNITQKKKFALCILRTARPVICMRLSMKCNVITDYYVLSELETSILMIIG